MIWEKCPIFKHDHWDRIQTPVLLGAKSRKVCLYFRGVTASQIHGSTSILNGSLGDHCCLFCLFHSPGCKLSEFERVTALKVYNWFANRRKEMKRRANIGETWQLDKKRLFATSLWTIYMHFLCGVYLFLFIYFFKPLLPYFTQSEAAILESHGIEVPSPSCHSNGEEGEMQEFAEQVTHRFSEQVSQHRDTYQVGLKKIQNQSTDSKTRWHWSCCSKTVNSVLDAENHTFREILLNGNG